MGTTVYDCGNPDTEGAHIYCHSRKDGKDGYVYLIINNSLTETTVVELPSATEKYTLSAATMRLGVMLLNGKELSVSDDTNLPELFPEKVVEGII